MRRKNFARIVFIGVAAAILAGCAGDGPGDKEQPGKTDRDSLTFVSKDYKPGNATVMKTEKGFYYYSDSEKGFRYYDPATGKDMFLCNKPECRHDGNEFCAATNDKYGIDCVGMYGGRIFATAIVVTDTQFEFQLISIALDGSALNEEVTYLTMENTGALPAYHIDKKQIYIHRNVAMIPVWMVGDAGMDVRLFFGTAVVNLDTKEVTYLDEEPLSLDNVEITDITAHGDYFYYCKKEGKKTVLHRYNITDGTDETHKLLVGFKGNYVVPDDNTVVYTKSDNRTLCVYHRETGENEEKLPLKRLKTAGHPESGGTWEEERAYEAMELKTDGTYIYVKEPTAGNPQFDNNLNYLTEVWDESCIHVFDKELTEVATVNMAEAMSFAKEAGLEEEESLYLHRMRQLYFDDDTVYVVSPKAGDYSQSCVYVCPKEEFLTGEPQFEYIFTMMTQYR